VSRAVEETNRRLLRVRDAMDRSYAQPLDIRQRPHGLLDHRPDALYEIDLESHPDDRRHDVGEHHSGVDAVATHRLQRHFCAQIGRVCDLPE